VRHGALISELEACVGDNGVRVVLLTAPRGAGLSTALRAFVEEIRGRGHRAEVVECERVGVQAGGAVDALLRARLGLEVATAGQALLSSLDTALPDLDPLAREFLAFAMGLSRDDFQTNRLDARSRWEGTLAEIGRWLGASSGGTWAWVLDDAVAVDAESLRLVEQLAQGATSPGLVVLAVRDDERQALEPRLRLLRSSGRMKEHVLPLFSGEALMAAFPQTASASRGVALTAALLEKFGREGGTPVTAEALVRAVMPGLPPSELTVLSVIATCGGRLPVAALDAVLGAPQGEVVQALESKLLVRRGPTLRCNGADETWLRFPTQQPEVDPAKRASWVKAIGTWAEGVLLSDKSPGLRQLAVPQAIRAAEATGDAVRLSLAWELSARLGGGPFSLRKAEAGASGVRRQVLARMLAEDELFRGEVQRAVTNAQAASRLPTASPASLPAAWLQVINRETPDELERWDALTPEEASCSLDLVRAEGLAQLGQPAETKRAFEALESRLLKLKPSAATAALWLRMARTWAWFAAVAVSDGTLARRICDTTRQRVSPERITASFHTMAFLRAEQVAHSHGGDAARARALADELIALSRARSDSREECIAWNARGVLHLRDGELLEARESFEHSLDLARNIGFRRREAVALHNLGLALCASGEYGAALACQDRYITISEQIGNLLARAYGPAAQAQVYVQQLETTRAETHLQRARRAAEENGWPGLVAWARHLSGLLKLLRHLEKRDTLLLSLARSDFLACLDLVEDRHASWGEELDPAEAGALLSLTWLCAGNAAQARAALPRAEKFADASVVGGHTVAALKELLDGKPPTASVTWFHANGHLRALELWTRFAEALGLPVPIESDVRTGL
jgi:tetratricopeptide (TPR) repeat protein